MPPVAVVQVVRSVEERARLAARWTYPLLLAPVLGAFFQILLLRQAPSIAWPFLVLVAAIATRLLRRGAVATELAATLGADGLALADRFVAAPEIADARLEGDALWVTTRGAERFELRVADAARERVEATLAALRSASASPALDAAGQRFLAEGPPSLGPGLASYREPAFDADRCLAVVEDAATAPLARIAAAERLADIGGGDGTTRTRIAAAAETTASPELREALHAALDRSGPLPARLRRAASP